MRPGRVVLALALAVSAEGCSRREAPASAPSPDAAAASSAPDASPSAPVPAASSADGYQKLVGRWMRSDADYMIWIRSVSPDGTLDASYLNPRPIHVAQARAWREEGVVRLRIEMQDRNYPGSYYVLAYDPGSDTLNGVYHQLVQNQQFEVAFSRLEAQPEGAGSSP